MNTNTVLNLLDDQAVLSVLKQLSQAEEWDKVIALSKACECAKQQQELLVAEQAYLETLTPAKRAHHALLPVYRGFVPKGFWS